MSSIHFGVSVIVPVYNAAKYVRNAVESAVSIDEVSEIVLIEDGSKDNGLEVCRQLERDYLKVKLYQHPNKENRGAGASRNLGIERASCDYVAFLDGDDWYLPSRFLRAKEIFAEDTSVEGVYEATGFYDESTKSLNVEQLTTLKNIVSPQDLLFTLLQTDSGRFHTNAITLKKSILQKSGLFDASLRLHQDTHLWLRLAHVGKLVPGRLKEPVAIRRRHELNRIQHLNKESRRLLHIRTFQWFENQHRVDPRAYRIIFNRYVGSLKKNILTRIVFTAIYLIKNPGSIKKLI